MNGAVPSPIDARDYPITYAIDMSDEPIPEDFEVWQPLTIEDQGDVGNCVAQALTNILECIEHQAFNAHEEYSTGYIYGTPYSTASTSGMYPREALKALHKEGDVLRSVWECFDENPMCREKRAALPKEIHDQARRLVSGYLRINSKEELQRYMMRYQLPVLIVAKSHDYWALAGDGYHATTCYGWISKETFDREYGYWEYKDLRYTNSWGGLNPKGIINCEKVTEMWGVIPKDEDDSMRGIEYLHPELQEICEIFVADCRKAGLNVKITDTLRTKEEQDALYAQGRTKAGQIVTNAIYPTSAHNWGVAFDVCRNEKGREYDDTDGFFAKCGEIGKSLGLTWGGSWKSFVDKPHFELAKFMPNSSTKWLRITYDDPINFMKTWEDNTMTAERLAELLPEAFAILAQKPASDWAKPALDWAKKQGIMVGDDTGNQMPQKPMMREEMAQMLFNMRNKSEV